MRGSRLPFTRLFLAVVGGYTGCRRGDLGKRLGCTRALTALTVLRPAGLLLLFVLMADYVREMLLIVICDFFLASLVIWHR